MAEFGQKATQLSDPQGSGTAPVAAVHEQANTISLMPMLGAVGDIFARGLASSGKDAAEARKNAVVGEYIKNEQVYSDALTTGQWNSAQVSTASRANYSKFLASNPEYIQELGQARGAVYGGTEVGEAQKKEDAAFALREKDKASAAGAGFTFYSGMSTEAENKTLDAYRKGVQVQEQLKMDMQASAEARAVRGETRAEGSYQMTTEDHVAKKNAADGVVAIASANFDAIAGMGADLQIQMSKGMPYEQALVLHKSNMSRVNVALLSVSAKNPELAAPWIKQFGDMDATIQAMLDPKAKTADEAALLKSRYDALITTQKLAAIQTNPQILNAVVASELFKGEPLVGLANSPVVSEFIMANVGSNPKLKSEKQVVGTVDDKAAFKATKEALKRLPSMSGSEQLKATGEAVNLVNGILKQTTTIAGDISPAALTQASSFYSSSEFGKFASEGKIDKVTASNVQRVFTTKYDPAVKTAIMKVLDTQQDNNTTIGENVRITMQGNNVVFENTSLPKQATPFDYRGKTGSNVAQQENLAQLNKAADGLNQLIRMHAHLEGTTDYAKYWENNKHILMPGVFMAGVQEGTKKNGYTFKGGDARNPNNWVKADGGE